MDETQKKYDYIAEVNIEDEMKKCYIDYAMSVIAARALPDARDGLKPVHRRILYSMSQLNLDPTKAYRKSARIVGDTMGKYHPHGDSSIYEAMVRMAQWFSMRYPLVDGHGNFGSIDGDGAAAQRYTEARLTKMAVEMLSDIEKDTVDFTPNFDETEKEPIVLPSKFPNLLVNGSSGIAVGMATNIPPHNLKEIVQAIVKIIDDKIENKDTDIEELLQIVKGPDFPTGGTILGTSGIKQSYRTGRGKINLRADAIIEPMPNTQNREHIVVTAIPYQVNKAKLVESIADLVKDKKIEGISDLRDESNREGMRIVIELKRDANANVVLNQLYKYTQMQISFGVIMIALINQEPRTLNLKQMLECYLDHQKEVFTRRTRFDLNKAQERANVLEGLKIALENIDSIIKIMRNAHDINIAKQQLIENFGLSEKQAQAIGEMRLRSLNALEREKIDNEYSQIEIRIQQYKNILSDEKQLYLLIKKEILDISDKYSDERKTKIVHDTGEIDLEDLIDEQTSVVTMTHLGYIKRLPLNTYRSQNRGGKGIIGMQTREEDFIEDLFITSSHNYMLFFTNLGKVYKLKVYEIPEAGRTARGIAVVNLLELSPNEKITTAIAVKANENDKYLFMITKKGIAKKTKVSEFKNVKKGGIRALTVRDDDELVTAKVTDGTMDILIATKYGMSVRFNEKEIRSTGRTAVGVKTIRLSNDDTVVDAEIVLDGYDVLVVASKGYGKRTSASGLPLHHRTAKGIKLARPNTKVGTLVGIKMINDNEELMLITSEGTVIRLRAKDISVLGRTARGVKLMNLNQDIEIVSMAKVNQEDLIAEETESQIQSN